jgi:hypothetical protein
MRARWLSKEDKGLFESRLTGHPSHRVQEESVLHEVASRPPYRLLHITDISDLPPYDLASVDERWRPFDFCSAI